MSQNILFCVAFTTRWIIPPIPSHPLLLTSHLPLHPTVGHSLNGWQIRSKQCAPVLVYWCLGGLILLASFLYFFGGRGVRHPGRCKLCLNSGAAPFKGCIWRPIASPRCNKAVPFRRLLQMRPWNAAWMWRMDPLRPNLSQDALRAGDEWIFFCWKWHPHPHQWHLHFFKPFFKYESKVRVILNMTLYCQSLITLAI